MQTLTAGQRKQLRARAHHLKPVITIGGKGLTDAVVDETSRALEHHQLIKIRVATEDRELRNAHISELCARTGATLVAKIGKTATLFKPDADSLSPPS